MAGRGALSTVPALRIRPLDDLPAQPGRDYVLYWMVAARRVRSNFALQRAVELALACHRLLLVLEALRCTYRFASDRLHRFVMQCARAGVPVPPLPAEGIAAAPARSAAAGSVRRSPAAGRRIPRRCAPALATMIELNDRFALDGRDPNSYAGIFWVLGRYDRPWAPQRPVFGMIRYMSSANTARKVRVRAYLDHYR